MFRKDYVKGIKRQTFKSRSIAYWASLICQSFTIGFPRGTQSLNFSISPVQPWQTSSELAASPYSHYITQQKSWMKDKAAFQQVDMNLMLPLNRAAITYIKTILCLDKEVAKE